VYVRNCKLEMLLRLEHDQTLTDDSAPAAEWRWMLPSVCDDHWHHYTIVYEHEQPVQLYVDGHEFTPTNTNPEVLYDKPLHAMKGVQVGTDGLCAHPCVFSRV
jgi:hypothetical protein